MAKSIIATKIHLTTDDFHEKIYYNISKKSRAFGLHQNLIYTYLSSNTRLLNMSRNNPESSREKVPLLIWSKASFNSGFLS